MSLFEIFLLIGTIIALYIIGVVLLKKNGLFEKYNISFYGPALLLRTKKGVGTLQKIAQKKRFWKGYGTFAVLFCFIMMILMVGLLVVNTWAVMEFTPEQQEQLPGIEFGLVIPGLNPILPLEYLFISYLLSSLLLSSMSFPTVY